MLRMSCEGENPAAVHLQREGCPLLPKVLTSKGRSKSCPSICLLFRQCSQIQPWSVLPGIVLRVKVKFYNLCWIRIFYMKRCSLEGKLWQTQCIKKQRHHFAKKSPHSQSYGFSSSRVWMWELDHKERWVPKNWWLMRLNCGVGGDSWESLGLQGDPTGPS